MAYEGEGLSHDLQMGILTASSSASRFRDPLRLRTFDSLAASVRCRFGVHAALPAISDVDEAACAYEDCLTEAVQATEPRSPIPTQSVWEILRAQPVWIVVFVLSAICGISAVAGFAVICAALFHRPWASGSHLLVALAVMVGGGLACVALTAAFTSRAILPRRRTALASHFPDTIVWAGLINSETKRTLQGLSSAPLFRPHGYNTFIVLAPIQIEFWTPSHSAFMFSGAVPKAAIVEITTETVNVATISRTASRLTLQPEGSTQRYVDVVANSGRAIPTVSAKFAEEIRQQLIEWVGQGGKERPLAR
jgi:hypothetical protein